MSGFLMINFSNIFSAINLSETSDGDVTLDFSKILG